MKTIHIAGVPEHFNLPWHMALEEGAFKQRGIALKWTDVPEGTGKMCELLQKGKADLAIILTEGIVKSISEGNPARIVQGYIASPLLWGIHVAAGSHFPDTEALQHKTAAISRPGSGSHLMVYLHAQSKGWDTTALRFKTVHTLEGAVTALSEGDADYFLWEHFTTKPLVDQKVFRCLDDFPTPWPCFVIAARTAFLEVHPGLLRHVLEVINLYTGEFKSIPSIDRTLANRYGQQLPDIREWLAGTEWSQDQLSLQTIDIVQDSLFNLKLIAAKRPGRDYLYP